MVDLVKHINTDVQIDESIDPSYQNSMTYIPDEPTSCLYLLN